MKNKICFALSLGLVLTASLPAQVVFSDTLTATSSSWIDSPANQGTGVLTFGSSPAGLAYSAAPLEAGPFKDSGYKGLAAYNAPSTSNWTAQVDINLATFSGLMQNLYVNLNLVVAKTGDSTNNNTSFALDRYRNAGDMILVQDIDTWVTVAGVKTHLTEIVNSTTYATLMIGYDAATKVLTYSYDSDGPTSGWNFVTAHTADITGWSMSGADTFSFVLAGGSGSSINLYPTQSVSASDAYFQNFKITAVPEPSVYAAIVGLGALGLAAYRRRMV